jgi:hypothetical protein
VTRIVDRGAIVAAYVGIGMALTIGVSFLLVIPIDPIVSFLALPAGLFIGYYANQRSGRAAGPFHRIIVNAVFAGLVTGLATAVLFLGVRALFFAADSGYRDPGLGGPITCETGADCVYQRYLESPQGPLLEGAGVTDAETFTAFYWDQQLSTATTMILLTVAGGLGGGLMYIAFRPRPPREVPTAG